MVGRPAPVLRLKTLGGGELRVPAQGRVSLVVFWATWCAPCRAEAVWLKRLERDYHAQGLRIEGLSMDDSPAPAERFQRREAINYPLAMADVATARAFGGVLGLPALFLVGRDGRVLWQGRGEPDRKALLKKILAALARASPPSRT